MSPDYFVTDVSDRSVNRGGDEVDDLYKAVISFVEARGGRAFILDGISILQWPGDKKRDYFKLCIGVSGYKPTKIYPANVPVHAPA